MGLLYHCVVVNVCWGLICGPSQAFYCLEILVYGAEACQTALKHDSAIVVYIDGEQGVAVGLLNYNLSPRTDPPFLVVAVVGSYGLMPGFSVLPEH